MSKPSHQPSIGWRLQLWRGFWPTQTLSAIVGLLFWAMGSPPVITMVYSLLIGNFCHLFITLGRYGLPMVLRRWWPSRFAHMDQGFPGMLPMLPVLALGVLLAYLAGTTIGDALMGLSSPMPWHGSNRGALTVLVISMLPAIAGTYYFASRTRLAALETQAAEAQLRLLESQLEPHMLFNTLANLRALIGVDPARAQVMLDHMIDYLRATLTASRQSHHPLSAEFSRLTDYLALMQIRMGERLQVQIDLPADLAALPVPALLLQPLVENAIKHGLEPLRRGGTLTVSARRDGQTLRLQVSDSGAGLDSSSAAPAPTGSGFGLTQVRERLRTLHGERASFSLAPAPQGGTLAEVRLPWPAAPAFPDPLPARP
jgi:signal transduction histidine kinase